MPTDMKELVSYLESIGIRGYEARAYLAIIELGEEAAPRIAAKAGIPLPRIYDVLDSLVKKGLLEVKIGRPRKYKALPPNIALTSYVNSYVNRIYEVNRAVVDRLLRLYMSRKEEVSPELWIMYSFDAAMERLRHYITSINYDAFLSANPRLYREVANTLHKVLKDKVHALFSLTLIGEIDEYSDVDRFLDIDNIEIRILPTGVLNIFESDLANVMIMGKGYTIYTNEWEFVLMTNDAYYFAYWRTGKKVKEYGVRRGARYRVKHHWIALSYLEEALAKGFNADIRVVGYYVSTGKPVDIEGRVVEVYRSRDDIIRSIIINVDGKKLSIGGLYSVKEDIEAKYMELEIK